MQDPVYLELKSGKRVLGEAHFCEREVCGKEFIRAAAKPRLQKYCSAVCARKKNEMLVICDFCNGAFPRKKSKMKNSRSGLQFCSLGCKNSAQSLKFGLESVWPSHYKGDDLGHRRLQRNHPAIQEMISDGCVGCGKAALFYLSVHHIDGDRSNNERHNLEVVCGNCHVHRHLTIKNGQLVHMTLVLTPREIVAMLDCDEEIRPEMFERYGGSKPCVSARSKRKNVESSLELPTLDELMILKARKSWDDLGADYGISGNAVKKRIRSMGGDPKVFPKAWNANKREMPG